MKLYECQFVRVSRSNVYLHFMFMNEEREREKKKSKVIDRIRQSNIHTRVNFNLLYRKNFSRRPSLFHQLKWTVEWARVRTSFFVLYCQGRALIDAKKSFLNYCYIFSTPSIIFRVRKIALGRIANRSYFNYTIKTWYENCIGYKMCQ